MEAFFALLIMAVVFAYILRGPKGPGMLLGCLFAPFKSCILSLATGAMVLLLIAVGGLWLIQEFVNVPDTDSGAPPQQGPAPSEPEPEPERFDYPVGDDCTGGCREGEGWYVSQDFADESSNRYIPDRLHCGEDWAKSGCAGAPVYAIGDGIVLVSAANRSYGHYVIIKHSTPNFGGASYVISFYGHLGSRDLIPGKQADGERTTVKRGDRVGRVGARGENGADKQGQSWAPHLHFELREPTRTHEDTFVSYGYYTQIPDGMLNPTDATSPGNSAQAGDGWIDRHR